jgi:hypothetical protein
MLVVSGLSPKKKQDRMNVNCSLHLRSLNLKTAFGSMEEVSYQLTDHELYNGLVAVARARKITRFFKIVGMVLIGVMVFVIAVAMRSGDFTLSPGFFLTLALGIYAYFLPEISARIQMPALKKSKNALTQPVNLRLRQSDYILRNENSTQKHAYDKLYAVEETTDFFLLRVTEGSAHIIPKRALGVEGTEKLRGILRSVQGLKTSLL